MALETIRRRALPGVFLALSLFGTPTAEAAQPVLQLIPQTVIQGDVFLITVNDTGTPPSARFLDRKILFRKSGEGFMGLGVVPRDASPGVREILVKTDGTSKTVSLQITKGDFPVDTLTLPPDRVTPSPENAARAGREAVRLGRIWKIDSEPYWSGDFKMPVGGAIGTTFGTRRILNGMEKNPHNGIDLKGPRGTPVGATNGGLVVLADDLFYGGNTVVVDHGLGLYSFYMHLDRITVVPGDRVARGNEIGRLGSTGRSTGPHLHFGMKLRGVNVNPLSMVHLPISELTGATP